MTSLLGDDDLNDFLNPSNACINPLFIAPPKPGDNGIQVSSTQHVNTHENENGTVASEIKRTPSGMIIKPRKNRNKMSITLEDDLIIPPPPTQKPGSTKKSIIQMNSETKTATLTVADCLACSGCITSTEVLLVKSNSIEKLRELLEDEGMSGMEVVFTYQSVVIADMLRYILAKNPELKEVLSSSTLKMMLSVFFKKQFKADAVIDLSAVPTEIMLNESLNEFLTRYNSEKQTAYPPPPKSVPISNSSTLYPHDTDPTLSTISVHPPGPHLQSQNNSSLLPLPILSSICPGLVCYVEKSFPLGLNHLSTVKSEMAIAGTLIKGVNPPTSASNSVKRNVLHISFAPCYDKKLEGTRRDLSYDWAGEGGNTDYDSLDKDVDLVLTAEELWCIVEGEAGGGGVWEFLNSLLEQNQEQNVHDMNVSLSASNEIVNNPSASTRSQIYSTLESSKTYTSNTSKTSGSSGHQAEFIFRNACLHLFNYTCQADEVEWRHVGRRGNGDFVEVKLFEIIDHDRDDMDVEGKGEGFSCGRKFVLSRSGVPDPTNGLVRLSFCRAYGFKNIQSVVSRLKSLHTASPLALQRSPGDGNNEPFYHYIEVMACPSGCANGGGLVTGGGEKKEGRDMPNVVIDRVYVVLGFMNEGSGSDKGGGDGIEKLYESVNSSKKYDGDSMSISNKNDSMFGSSNAIRAFHTRFHNVPEMKLGQGAVKGLAVADTIW